MLRVIMVPLDGSRFAEQALPLAVTIARRANARLHVVTVRPAYPVELLGTEADEYLEKLAEQLRPEVADVTWRTLRGANPLAYRPPVTQGVAEMLAQQATEQEVGLVVVTTHGRGGLRRAWLDSVADALVRLSPAPVLLVKPKDEEFSSAAEADRGIPHIVVPLDGSADAERALEYAVSVGELFDARYTLLRVMLPLAYTPHYDSLPDYITELASPLSRDSMLRYLEDTAAPQRTRGLSVATEVLQHASAPTAIADYAAQHGGALIAMTTSGAGAMRRLLLGSVADKVMRGAETPVLMCNVHQMPEHGTAVAAGATTSLMAR
ncbi:MAG: universal stress protein [Gemmatimonadota bacterium]